MEKTSNGGSNQGRRKFSIRRGIFLLPSFFTLLNMLLGFYAIVSALKGDYLTACTAVMVAILADGLDGWIARMTHTTSEFGVELDSLADLITFGAAPALILYIRWLDDIPRVGWVCAFIFVAAGAVRLARFNAYDTTSTSAYFNGLPIPAAAAVTVSLILLDVKIFPGATEVSRIVPAACALLAILMVSNIRFLSFKKQFQGGRIRYHTLLGILLLVFVFVAKTYAAFVTLCLIYLLVSLVGHLLTIRRIRPVRMPVSVRKTFSAADKPADQKEV